jgi:hypothetical protein
MSHIPDAHQRQFRNAITSFTTRLQCVHYASTSLHDEPFHSPPNGVAAALPAGPISPIATHSFAFGQLTLAKSDVLPLPGPGTLCADHVFPL